MSLGELSPVTVERGRHPATRESLDRPRFRARGWFADCGDRHLAHSEPRLLSLVQRPIVTDWQIGPLLEAAVSECWSIDDGSRPSGLIIIRGRLDGYSIESAKHVLHQYARFARSVVLDLSRVDAIDNAGVLLVESLESVVTRQGGSLHLHDPRVGVLRRLEMSELHSSLAFCCPQSRRTN